MFGQRSWLRSGTTRGWLAIAGIGALAVVGLSVATPASSASPQAARHAIPDVGCSTSRVAVPFYAGASTATSGAAAKRADSHAPSALVPCLTDAGPTNETANVGVSPDGTVFYGPRIDNPSLPIDFNSQTSQISRSTDGGKTWTAVTPTSNPVHTSAVPWMSVDPQTGRIWYAEVGSNPALCSGQTFAHVSWSDDDGRTWHNPQAQNCRELQGGMSIVEGPAPRHAAQPKGYPHVVYHCGNIVDGVSPLSTHCWKSLDGGKTWDYVEGPNTIPGCTNERPRGRAVGPDGTFYMSIQCDGQLLSASSVDEGTTWQIHSISTIPIDRLDVSSVAVDKAGDVYVSWVGGTAGGTGDARLLGQPYVSVSRDHGRTWSTPTTVAVPGVEDVSEVAVLAGAKGHVSFSYLGTTDGTNFNGYIAETWNALSQRPLLWGTSINDPSQPLMSGAVATSATHGDRMWFITESFDSHGTPWAAFHCSRTTACPLRDGVVGKLATPRPS
jgi:hypothetical protein